MQSSRDALIRAIHSLPKITDDCIACSEFGAELHSEPPIEPCGAEAPIDTIAQLRQALSLERFLRRLAEKLCDSLEPAQIMQTTVQELTFELRIKGCNLARYDLEQQCSTLRYECFGAERSVPLSQAVSFGSQPELYQQLLRRQTVQFCRLQVTCLACPISVSDSGSDSGSDADAAGVLGDLWLFKPSTQCFSPQEVWLVQQVARHCAVALRQAELYQQAKAQVDDLERLHQRKDDFLSTVSHELRTPMSNIKMAIQLLEMSLEHLDPARVTPAQRYLKILRDETSREITLINDLLDLSRLEAGTEPIVTTTVNPVFWLPPILEPFIERAKLQQQQFQVDLATYLPPLTTDLGDLERIFSELLNNACKYTPAGERIIFSARLLKTPASARLPVFLFSVTNSGIEIPLAEQPRIFEKFYRISSHDPWRQGGTGLGLALVKGLVERLSGQMRVESYAGLTRFIVELPCRPSSDLEQAGR
jgi:signal transduction histidine kinase